MESINVIHAKPSNLKHELAKITLQNNLQDIINIINTFHLANKNKSGNKSKYNSKLYEEISKLIQSTIQDQIKNYIEKIELNVKKYWYTDMESKLYIFLNELKVNWDFFEEYFFLSETETFNNLEQPIYEYILNLKKSRAQIEIETLLEDISQTFDYWANQKAQKCLELSALVDRKGEIEAQLLEIEIELVKYNLENNENYSNLKNLKTKFPILQNREKGEKLIIEYEKKLRSLNNEENLSSVLKEIDLLEESLLKGGGNQEVELKILEKLLNCKIDQIEDILKRLIQLCSFYYSRNTEKSSILNLYPELAQSNKKIRISLEYEGGWNLASFYKGEWIPSYRFKDIKEFSEAEFNQVGEWKNRKFISETWSFIGKVPIGTIFKLKYKKEILHFIVNADQNEYLRSIEPTSIDENLITQYFKQSSIEESRNKPISSIVRRQNELDQNLNDLLLSDLNLLKLFIKFLSTDKKSLFLLSSILKTNIVKDRKSYIELLQKGQEDKYLRFLEKNI
jgi:hypothetical protein